MWNNEFTHKEVKKDRDEDLARIERSSRELADGVAKLLGREARNKKEDLYKMKEAVSERAGEAGEYITEKKREADKMVRENPWGAVAIAAVVGAIFGSIAATKKKR